MPTGAIKMNLGQFANARSVDWRMPFGGPDDIPVDVIDDFPWFVIPDALIVFPRNVTGFNCRAIDAVQTRFGFPNGEGLLLTKYRSQDSAIHLHFDQPVSAVGVNMTGDGIEDDAFLAQLEIDDPVTGARFSVSEPSRFKYDVVGSGLAFIGAQGNPGERISDVWLDIKTSSASKLKKVAVGNLLVLV